MSRHKNKKPHSQRRGGVSAIRPTPSISAKDQKLPSHGGSQHELFTAETRSSPSREKPPIVPRNTGFHFIWPKFGGWVLGRLKDFGSLSRWLVLKLDDAQQYVLQRARCFKPVVSMVATIAMVIVTYLSYRVSDSQNRTSKKQGENQLLINIQSSQSATAAAHYSEVRDILNASGSSHSGQIFALRRFAETMAAEVCEQRVSGRTQKSYPNVKPMKVLIHQFLRAQRSSPDGSYSQSLASVSEEVIKTLAKLGPQSSGIWTLAGKQQRDLPNAETFESTRMTCRYDLTYLKPDFFVGAQLPFLFSKAEDNSTGIMFPDKADFGSAYLCGANLSGSSLRNAVFRSADLRGARFKGADLSGANFEEATLTGASFDEANLEGANFNKAIGYVPPSSPK